MYTQYTYTCGTHWADNLNGNNGWCIVVSDDKKYPTKSMII